MTKTMTMTVVLLVALLAACGTSDGNGFNNINDGGTPDDVQVSNDASTLSDSGMNSDADVVVPPICGDGLTEGDEECDDGPENSDTRPNACRTNCVWAHCGDTILDNGEQCDSQNIAGSSCQALGFEGGVLSCAPDCTFDTSLCTDPTFECGDGVAEGPEECDGADLKGQTCTSLGQPDGPLGCTPGCTFDVSNCVGPTVCGDGVVEGYEICDTAIDPYCHPGCVTSCGDGIVQPFLEICDDGNNTDGDACGNDCLGFCGDGIVQPQYGEECDWGISPTCQPDCTIPVCGDGVCFPAAESPENCHQDCPCAPNEVYCPVVSQCCQQAGPQPAQCCVGSGCVVWSGGYGAANCGSCGNDCQLNEVCVNGMCVEL